MERELVCGMDINGVSRCDSRDEVEATVVELFGDVLRDASTVAEAGTRGVGAGGGGIDGGGVGGGSLIAGRTVARL